MAHYSTELDQRFFLLFLDLEDNAIWEIRHSLPTINITRTILVQRKLHLVISTVKRQFLIIAKIMRVVS